MTLWYRCFPLNFAKFPRTPSLQNTSGRLLLESPENSTSEENEFYVVPVVPGKGNDIQSLILSQSQKDQISVTTLDTNDTIETQVKPISEKESTPK